MIGQFLEEILKKKGSNIYWICQCECGTVKSVLGTSLRNGSSKGCGCKRLQRTREALSEDLSGQEFGRLTVISLDLDTDKKGAYWICQCECGTIKSINAKSLKQHKTLSCGCLGKEIRQNNYVEDLTNKKFNHWLVLSRNLDECFSGKGAYWNCKCDCGTIKPVSGFSLKNNTSKSCGCLKSHEEEKIKECLDELGWTYEREYSFPELRGDKNPLKFDFCVKDAANKIKCLIEYQGEQHYKDLKYFKSTSFEKRQEYDEKKRQYCKENNIILYEISYFDFDKITPDYIHSILNER